MLIRLATPSDAPILARLNGVVQQVHHEALPDQFKAPDPDAVEPFFAEQLARLEVVAYVADEAGGGAVGYVLGEELHRSDSAFTASGSALYIHHIAVDPAVRHRGCGRALIHAIEDEAQRRGIENLRLDYWTFNEQAKRFFASLGFEPFNERARKALRSARSSGY
jgi:ribosomal protein S18 acetylase RimI-like enzyme